MEKKTGKNNVTLRVAESQIKDAGRGIVRIDPKHMSWIKAEVGDVIRLKSAVPSKKSGKYTVAKLMPLYGWDSSRQRGSWLG